jgi:hypothetical protein
MNQATAFKGPDTGRLHWVPVAWRLWLKKGSLFVAVSLRDPGLNATFVTIYARKKSLSTEKNHVWILFFKELK